METIRYEKDQLQEVVRALQAGKTIAFPTDTVYGLGVCYDDEKALLRLKQAKSRPESKPIPMMVSSLKQIEQVANVHTKAKKLMEAFMPGAFTIILQKKDSVPGYVTNDMDTIAIRMPDDDFVLAIMDVLQKPLLVSSANISNEHSCQYAKEVIEQLDGRIDGIVLGESGLVQASTIVDASSDVIRILREGPVSKIMIENILEETI